MVAVEFGHGEVGEGVLTPFVFHGGEPVAVGSFLDAGAVAAQGAVGSRPGEPAEDGGVLPVRLPERFQPVCYAYGPLLEDHDGRN